MAALQRIRSRQQVNKFCVVGLELLTGPVCLSERRWESALNSIEVARLDPIILPPLGSLSIESATEAVRHYHNLHARCARLIVMPCRRWQRWHEGLRSFMGVKMLDSVCTLDEVCRELLTTQETQFAVAFWGCCSSVNVRLESLMMRRGAETTFDTSVSLNGANSDQIDDASVDEKSNVDVNVSLVRLRNRCFSELYQFQRLAHDAAHLFGYYGVVGRAERQWLIDTFLSKRQNEESAEALVRCSFKRDVGVPSVELESGILLEEYGSFEVIESKEKAVRKKAQSTLKGLWNSKASALHAYELLRQKNYVQEQQQQQGDKYEESLQKSVYDERGFILLDELVQCLRREAGRPEVAFALMMERVLEKEPFPALMDLARLDVFLNLLQQWFNMYTYEKHRECIPLFLEADLWTFLLERHTELLKWVVFHYCGSGIRMDVSGAVEGVKALCFSILRCFEVYCEAMTTRHCSKDAKMHLDLQIRRMISEWVRSTLVDTFLDGILHMCMELEPLSSSFPSPGYFTVRLALDKAQLLLMCDAPLFLMDARQILFPIPEIGFREMGALCSDVAGDALTRWVMTMIGVLNTLCQTLKGNSGVGYVGDGIVHVIQNHYQTLQRLSPAHMVELVRDEWLNFLSDKGRLVLSDRRVSWLNTESLKCALHEPVVQRQKQPGEESGEESGRKRARKEE